MSYSPNAVASLIASHRVVQRAAKVVLEALPSKISASDTETSIAALAHVELCSLGYPETWYYARPALVLLGSRSCASLSGREYLPALEPVGAHNLVTVDLSPAQNGYWGDCARSFYVENGVVSFELCREFENDVERRTVRRIPSDVGNRRNHRSR